MDIFKPDTLSILLLNPSLSFDHVTHIWRKHTLMPWETKQETWDLGWELF